MINVAFISHQSRLEGAERSLLELMEDLRETDIRPSVIVLKEEGPLMRELDRLEIPWRSVPSPWWTRKRGRPPYPAGPVLARIIRDSVAVTRILEEWETDLVYSNTSVIGTGAVASILAGKPHIWHIREAASQPENYQFLLPHGELEAFVGQVSNRVLFNSQAVRAEWTTGALPELKTEVVYNRVAVPEQVIPAPPDRKVDVVIPFHNDPFILKCLESVLTHRSPSLNRVWILDDMTRDEGLISCVRELAESRPGLLTYRRNGEHSGFVGTCNAGMRLSDENDLVLLNSDTLVTSGWIEKLKQTAHQRKEIGTVTPMSNNASLVSLPELYENNPDDDPERTARWLEAVAPADHVEIPTAHGYCIYIKREAIRTAGYFDRETFGTGYCEENDYSMRLRENGFRNVASCRSYVYHKGAQSFGAEEKKRRIGKNYKILLDRYPAYPELLREFRANDPFHDLREPLRALGKNPRLEESFKIVIAGSVLRWKGQLEAVRAAASLAADGCDISLWICGPVKEEDYLEEILQEASGAGIDDRVVCTGYLDRITGMLAFADLTIVCSSFEPFGRVTLESMLTGTPVVGADGGGTAELLQHGETGRLYPPGDTVKLAEEIGELYRNREELQRLGARARAWAEEFNRTNDSVKRIHGIIAGECSRPNPAAGLEWLVRTLTGESPPKSDGTIRSLMGRVRGLMRPG